MRRSATAVLIMSLAIFCVTQGLSQERPSRSDIYDTWDELNLTVTTGEGRVTWLPDGMGYLESEVDAQTQRRIFYKVNPKTQKRSLLFDKKTEESIITAYNRFGAKKETGLPFRGFDYLDDGSGIRFTVGDVGTFVYSFQNDELIKLIPPRPETPGWIPHRSSRQLTSGLYSPDFKKVAYVKDYDLYVLDSITGQEERVTFGGTEKIMNGRTDWVYPEETGQSEAFWWSPDGAKIAFFQFDVRAEYQYPLLHEIDLETEEGFDHYRFETVLEMERYPKAGRPNPTVKLFIVDLTTGGQVEVETASTPDVYILKCEWRDDGSELIFQRLNRFQNKLELLAANPVSGAIRTILIEEEECFVRLHNNFRQPKDGKRFTWSSERSGWNHLYLYDFQGNMLVQLTGGEWEVSGIDRIDEKNNYVYFTANMKQGLESHFCRVKLNGRNFAQLTTEEGTHRVSIDAAAQYYTDSYSSLTTPGKVNLHSADGRLIRTLSTTTLDQGRMEELGLDLPELVRFTAADGVTELHALLYKPAQYDPAKIYPLLVTVYGGPSGGVRNSFSIGDRTAQLGYFVVKQDDRGTTNRGKKYLTETYLKFGQVEIDDQAAGVRQITRRPYIDGTRVGIYGGSYGGYSTCMALLRYPELFHVGVASSSVTDWRSYDTIYTERYMRTPEANPEGYRLGSAMTYAANLQGKLLLVHGLVDNNVHMGNTMHLADALQKAGKEFDLMIYPENRHGIGGYHRDHLTTLRTTYFLKHLKPEGWEKKIAELWE